ncbi:acyl-CoA N-acyltransferase [Boletus reticuloceps]|uniref:Histone acetyltransferase type B catalytic subunit n=1 Tax=Boletus reticuloceps TaxID=495285 RepID=A0A8I2YVI3_9AGAM|nr:acyl-CoA N-acyltransferase [Boletus reticuloceps]
MANISWTVDSNEALVLSLVRAQEDKQVLGKNESFEGFHPTFTYPIYGEDEKLYGYQDLVIDFRFASGSLAQFLSVRYAEKLPASSTVDDVEGIFSPFIPPGYETEEEAFLARVENDASSFQPIGKCIHSYTRPAPSSSSEESNVEYEVYHATFEDSGFREYHRRMQIFILLYIEAGSYINEEEDGWDFVVLFEKRKRKDGTATYHFVGYSSLYNFYCFPEKVRLRLSQFVILPPYQRQGHGSELYTAIYNFVLSQAGVSELTVEDPAEAFEDLRDRNDLRMLLANEQLMNEGFGTQSATASHGGGRVQKARSRLRAVPQSASGSTKSRGKMGPPVDRAWSEKWRKDLKIAGRQFHRLVEILIMLHLDPTDIQGMRAFRLHVKERLYRFNFEILAQMEKEERLQKLEETFQNVQEDYKRLLAMI